MTTNQKRLLGDAFRFAERLYILSHLLGACILVALTALLLQLTHLYGNPGPQAMLVAVAMLVATVQLVRFWYQVRLRLSAFEFDSTAANGCAWQVAPRLPGERFDPVPRGFVAAPQAPASDEECWEIGLHAERYGEVAQRLQACLAAHGFVSNHDAVNLVLMAVSLRNGEYAARSGEWPSTPHT